MMMALSNRATTVPSTALLLLLLAVAFSSRWTVQGLVSLSLQRHRMPQQAFFRRQSLVVLRAQDEENEATSTESNELAEEEYEEQEDPEIEALKEEIADSEKKLKEKKRQLMNLSDRADDFSKEGYARKVAEMENMRRARSMLNSSGRSSAMAAVLGEFLPVLDRLEDLKVKYEDDDFGKQYGALPGAIKAAYSELGAKEYTVTIGDRIDKSRMVVIDSEHSENHASDTVLRPISMGLELQGNPIRLAECVACLGPEPVAIEESSEKDDEPGRQKADSYDE